MFYSTQLLTSREYGVATVWLVATLGQNSTLKKVSRKAIVDVDVQKACETIENPEAPMALRLQSNLLYGVARVYLQQCQYVLTDVEAASNRMRTLFKYSSMDQSVVPEASLKAKPSALLLPDDPDFFASFDLVGDLDPLPYLDNSTVFRVDSQLSTLSPRRSVPASIEGDPMSIGGLQIEIPPSASSFGGVHFQRSGSYGGSAGIDIGGGSDAGPPRQSVGFLDDMFGIGPDGELVDVEYARAPMRERTELENRMSSVARRDQGHVSQQNNQDGFAEDDNYVAPTQNVEELPDADHAMQLDDHNGIRQPDGDWDQPMANAADAQNVAGCYSTTSETAEAPVRRTRVARVMEVDSRCELSTNTMKDWQENYGRNMRELLRKIAIKDSLAQAKNNAAQWVMGMDSSFPTFRTSDPGPLHIFSSEKIFEILRLHQTEAGWKRPREEVPEERDAHSSSRSKRLRTEGPEQEQARGMDEEAVYLPMGDDDESPTNIEQGRDVPTPLEDRHHSSLMPWHQSGSQRPTNLFSVGMRPSSSAGGPSLPGASRRGSRLISASPLHGRGQQYPSVDYDDNPVPDPASFDNTNMLMMDMEEGEDFERYGRATSIDTQTAVRSQWVRSVLEGESMRFLSFVQTAIEEADDGRAKAAPGDEEDETLMGSIEFEVLLSPAHYNQIVAAQAFLHVLSLGSKSLLQVDQRGKEAHGPIVLRVPA